MPILALTFFAVLSGAGLAFAWYLAVEPVLARIATTRVARALHSRAALAFLLVLPFAALAAMIAMHGRDFLPSLNSATGSAREAQLAEARQEAPHDLDQAVKDLEAKLKKSPDDQEGWRLLARSYADLGEPDKAADAARHAAELGPKPGDAEAQSERGEDLVTAAKGMVGPDARAAFRAALAADPGDPRARFFMGLAEAQDGNSDKALDRWLALERDSPPDAPWLEGLRANITRLAQQIGLSADQLAQRRGAPMPAATAAAAPPAAAAAGGIPGPSTADVAAAQEMSPQDRAQMIQGMVAKLAAEMAQQPKNVDGWLRLGRAYDVLGEKQKSLDAYRRAAAADPSRADARQALARAEAAQ